eukprot:Phypoly_transcript_06115.p1 GENE.Phypoly_transcript_06115~~Phypoly_transcript_06115.p1  ORF type:complete len:453 (+),score=74.10 Phypoly_transcript_06115:414-1772(+)
MELFQSWRKYDVIKREWVYQLEDNFEKVKDKYVYLRTHGIKKLLNLVRSLSEQEDISVFLRLQNHKETNIALHILAYVLQNLPVSILDQALKPFPQVVLKDETTPTPTPRPSSPGTSTTGTCNSVIIKGSTIGSSTTGTFNSMVINKSTDSMDAGTFNSVVINKSSDSVGTFNSVVINKSSDDTPSQNNTYNSVVFNDDGNESDHTDTDYNTIAYNNNTISGSAALHEPVLLRRSAGGTAVYANPSTTEERALALELIQGVCLIHPGSKSFLFENGIVPLLILLLETKEDTPAATILGSPIAAKNLPYSHSAPSLGGHAKPDETAPKKDANFPRKQEIMEILDALLCVLVDHEPLQKEFVDSNGVDVCVRVLKNPAFGREVRAKCVVFLVYLVRYFPVGHRVKLLLNEFFGEQLANVLLRSVRLGQQSDSQTVPGESFLDAFDKNVGLSPNK